MSTDTERTFSPAEEAYIEARKDTFLARANDGEEHAAERRASEAARALRAEVGPIDSERGWPMIDAAIERSGLGEDHPVIKRARVAQTRASQVEEAVANGADYRVALLLAALGTDPREVGELYD